MDHSGRQERVRQQLDRLKLDCLLVTHLPNVRYLCGFSGSAGALVFRDGELRFFTDGRYAEQARAEVQGARVTVVRGSALAAAAHWVGEKRCARLGVEGDHLTLSAQDLLRGRLPKRLRLRPTAGLVERLRMVKEPAEIEAIRRAVRLGSRLFEKVARRGLRPGRREAEVAAEIEFAARRAGAERMAFETIVAAGPRSARPHGVASAAPLPARGFVVLDFGVILSGYCSDMTRTVHLGRPSGPARRMYQAVLEAQAAAIAAVAPGVTAAEVDGAARSVLRRAGLGRYFTHSTGHGVGLEIHEPPRLARGQQERLRAGMVITIEPGVYIAGRGGVRIEDIVAVTADGCRVLTPTPKELMEIAAG